jgi:hypothetical protein
MKDCNNGINFIILATVVSIILAKILNDAEQNVLGNFLQSIGSNISTIAAYDAYIKLKTEGTTEYIDKGNNTTIEKSDTSIKEETYEN